MTGKTGCLGFQGRALQPLRSTMAPRGAASLDTLGPESLGTRHPVPNTATLDPYY